jgi:hypothetical protein
MKFFVVAFLSIPKPPLALRAQKAISYPFIDRESGGRANLEANGLTLRPLFLMSELKGAASATPIGATCYGDDQ